MNKTPQPPKLLLRFLRWFCHPEYTEDIEGDLNERFEKRVEENGAPKAKWLFVWDVVKLFRPGIIRPTEGFSRLNDYGILKNYIKVSRRNIWRHKTFSFLQLSGLTLSICVALIVLFIVDYEFSFDKFHKDADRIYRVTTKRKIADNVSRHVGVPGFMPEVIEADFTSVESVVPLFYYHGVVKIKSPIKDEGNAFENGWDIIYTNKSYFDMFDYRWLAGSKSTALSEPNSVVITEKRMQRYFGFTNAPEAIGKTITYGKESATVTGVVQNLPRNTDLDIEEFRFREPINLGKLEKENWFNGGYGVQLLIKASPGTTKDQLVSQFASFEHKYYKNAGSSEESHSVQPLLDMHFDTNFLALRKPATSKTTMYGLLFLAAFLILMGALNYISLSTAQNETRWKEIGVRKTLGGLKKHLISQSLIETVLLSSLAGVTAYLLAPAIINIFNDYLPETSRQISIWGSKSFLITIGLSLVVGLLAGIFPALAISKLKPLGLIKKQPGQNPKAHLFNRHSLSVIKFMIAQFFIVAVVIVEQQTQYSVNKELGFERKNVITIYKPWNASQSEAEVVLQKIKSIPAVDEAILSGLAPLKRNYFGNMSYLENGEQKEIYAEWQPADSSYINFYKLNIIAGSNIQSTGNVNKDILINESFMKKMGYNNPNEVLGIEIRKKTVVGVVRDYHTVSTHSPIDPLVIGEFHEFNGPPNLDYHIKINELSMTDDRLPDVISEIEKAWTEVLPISAFNYEFLDDQVEALYAKERKLSHLLKWSVGMTIFISCLGLLGIALFQVNKRSKEIGIRKVLGASAFRIMMIFSIDSIKPVVIAIVLSTPITLYAAKWWLENFTYSMEIRYWMFALPALLMIFIALMTIGLKVGRAAIANPVDSLRDE